MAQLPLDAQIIRQCPGCGGITRRKSLCAKCERSLEHRAYRIGGQPRKLANGVATYRVLWSPDPCFRAGSAEFTCGDFRETLGDGSWPLGMIVEQSVSKNLYVVCRGPSTERPNCAPDDWLPPQRLRRVSDELCQGRIRRAADRSAAAA